MMLRIAGALILLASALWAGLAMSKAAKSHRNALRTAVKSVRRIRRSIELFDTPKDLLCRENPEITSPYLYTALAEDADILREFSDALGRGYKEDTLKLCDWVLAVLEERRKTVEGEYPARARLCIALPLFAVLSLIVMIF